MAKKKFKGVVIKKPTEWAVEFNYGRAHSTSPYFTVAICKTSTEAFGTALCHMAQFLMFGQNVDTWQVSVREIQDNTFIIRCTYDYPDDNNPEPDFFEYNISPIIEWREEE